MKRKRARKEPERIDLGTPETRAKLRAAPWSLWPNELKLAVFAIYDAVQLIAGGCAATAQDPTHVSRMASSKVTSHEMRLAQDYRQWVGEMERRRWSIRPVLDVVLDAVEPAKPEMVRQALGLWKS